MTLKKFSIIPSVSLLVDISGFLVQRPSAGMLHATELSHVLGGGDEHCKPVFSDGGPDHRLTYVSVKVSLQFSRSWTSTSFALEEQPLHIPGGIQWSASCPRSILAWACSVLD